MTFFAGLVLGDSARALSVIETANEYTTIPPQWNRKTGRLDTRVTYHLRLVRRLDSDASYQDVIAQVGGILAAEPVMGRCTVVADVGNGGRPLATLLRQSLHDVIAATVDDGAKATTTAGGYSIARSEMASALRLVLQQRALKIPPALLRVLNSDAVCLDSVMLAVWWCERCQLRGESMFLLQFRRDLSGELKIKSVR